MKLPTQAVIYILSCALSAVGLGLVIVGLVTPLWTYAHIEKGNDTRRLSLGLWQSCADKVCEGITVTRPATLIACEVLALLSALFGVICCFVLSYHLLKQLCKRPSSQWLFTVAMATGASSAVCIIIAVSIWRAEYYDDEDNIYVGYSLILAVVGGTLLAIAGGAGAFSSRRNSTPTFNQQQTEEIETTHYYLEDTILIFNGSVSK
ncbi:hypothetical protein Btru_032506 [Bulinus truncatus]|nr:hypothetical protein Btru_032506 [Bulinus truncatus]